MRKAVVSVNTTTKSSSFMSRSGAIRAHLPAVAVGVKALWKAFVGFRK
jgi:hypothetical protein